MSKPETGLLALTFRVGEKVVIDCDGKKILVILGKLKQSQAQILFKAPKEVKILRESIIGTKPKQGEPS